MTVPDHPCQPPATTAVSPDVNIRNWTCSTCGQRWFVRRDHTLNGPTERWVRRTSRLIGRHGNDNLWRAYELEQLASVAPWWQALARARARREAKALRRLEGQVV